MSDAVELANKLNPLPRSPSVAFVPDNRRYWVTCLLSPRFPGKQETLQKADDCIENHRTCRISSRSGRPDCSRSLGRPGRLRRVLLIPTGELSQSFDFERNGGSRPLPARREERLLPRFT